MRNKERKLSVLVLMYESNESDEGKTECIVFDTQMKERSSIKP